MGISEVGHSGGGLAFRGREREIGTESGEAGLAKDEDKSIKMIMGDMNLRFCGRSEAGQIEGSH
jgi:hypothetical protein